MAETPKPNFQYLWAETGTVLNPGDAKIQQGWIDEIPPFDIFNFPQNRMDTMLRHLDEHGIGDWTSWTNYAINGLTLASDGFVYKSLVADNQGNDPTSSPAEWILWTQGSDRQWFTKDDPAGDAADEGAGYFVTTTTGTPSMTLPASPAGVSSVRIVDVADNFKTIPLQINGNGNNIEGSPSYLANVDGLSLELRWDPDDSEWKIILESQNIGSASTVIRLAPRTQSGFRTANNGTTAIDFHPGLVLANDKSQMIQLASMKTKQINNPWSEGSGVGGRAAGVALAVGTYFGIAVAKTNNESDCDIVFDTDYAGSNALADANVIAAGYTVAEAVMGFFWDGSELVPFKQRGKDVSFNDRYQDFSGGAPTVSTPIGLTCVAHMEPWLAVQWQVGAFTSGQIVFTDTDQPDIAPTASVWDVKIIGGNAGERANKEIRGKKCDSSSDVNVRASTSGISMQVRTSGFTWDLNSLP